MEIFQTRKQTLAFFMPGFLSGILYVNFIAKQYLAEPGIFSPVFLERFAQISISADTYLQMLLRLRALPFLVLFGASMTRARKAASVLFLIWTGFSAGALLSQVYIDMGLRGGILCMAGIMPQFLFYIPAYLVLLEYCRSYPSNRWNRQKTCFSGIMIAAGIASELYANPPLMKWLISLLL